MNQSKHFDLSDFSNKHCSRIYKIMLGCTQMLSDWVLNHEPQQHKVEFWANIRVFMETTRRSLDIV